MGPAELDLWIAKREEYFKNTSQIQGLHRINPLVVRTVHRLGKRTEIVEY